VRQQYDRDMRLACVLLAVFGCSSAPKPDTTTTPTSTEATTSTDTATPPTTTAGATAATTTPPPSAPSSLPTTTTGAPVTRPSQASGGSTAASSKPLYSCFSYVAAASNSKRNNCMRTEDCPAYVEQARSIKAIRDLTGCASVATVWCFHQVVKDDPIGVDVCQPTADDCKASRTVAVKARESVDTDCAQR
jgi:hypothetical protein